MPLEKCRADCKNKITYEDQREVFSKYWSLKNYKQRVLFVSGLMEIRNVKTTVRTCSKKREFSYLYYIPVKGANNKVCQKCFRYTLGETDNFIKTVAKKMIQTGTDTYSDKRGKAAPVNKISDEKVNEIKRHILSFPAYESHYSRAHTSKLYFESSLTLTLMYKLYCQSHTNNVSITKYSQIFKGIYNNIKMCTFSYSFCLYFKNLGLSLKSQV